MGSSKGYKSPEYSKHPFTSPSKDILDHLKTNDQTGLDHAQVQEAQRTYGPNKLEGEGAVQWYRVLLKQVSNAMILVSALLESWAIGRRDRCLCKDLPFGYQAARIRYSSWTDEKRRFWY